MTTVYAVALLAGLLAGCAKHTEPVPRTRELSVAEKNFEKVWRASLRVLSKYRFEPAIQDRRAGIIKTHSATSKHFTEFWRQEATTSRDVLESSLHTVYRTVTIKVAPVEGDGEKFRAEVQVDVSRSDQRAPRITSASQAYDLFSMAAEERLQVEYGEEPDDKPSVATLGRDENLEARLAAEIAAAVGS